jgi:hypothetical protein
VADQVLDHLAALIDSEQKEIIRTWQDRVRQLPSAEGLDELALQDSVADLLDEIATTMLADREIGFGQRPFHSGPMHHASQRHELGFNIGELVIEYMVLREILQEFAQSRNIALDNNAGIVLHR